MQDATHKCLSIGRITCWIGVCGKEKFNLPFSPLSFLDNFVSFPRFFILTCLTCSLITPLTTVSGGVGKLDTMSKKQWCACGRVDDCLSNYHFFLLDIVSNFPCNKILQIGSLREIELFSFFSFFVLLFFFFGSIFSFSSLFSTFFQITVLNFFRFHFLSSFFFLLFLFLPYLRLLSFKTVIASRHVTPPHHITTQHIHLIHRITCH